MKIDAVNGLEAKLAASEDAEALSEHHYALDIYDGDPPLTLEIEFTEKGLEVPAAAELLFSAELDGYYMGARIADARTVHAAIVEWMKHTK